MKYYLAIDLGASSGRHIIGYQKGKEIVLEEIHRFKTGMDDSPNGLVWDIPRLFSEIKSGIKKAFEKYHSIESISIDTWGVDYVLMSEDKEIPPYYAYRNNRNVKSAEKVHKIMQFIDIYSHTGIQFQEFNTLYQLFDDKQKGRLDNATDYLMLPSYFTYKLTGVKTHEFTNESTGSLINAETGKYDFEILDKLGLPRKLFKEMKQPGYLVGELLPSIQKEVGGNSKIMLCASHDTASAFEAIDVDEDSIILSSGTWSLLGIKSKTPIISDKSLKANYTNEGGVNYIRFLKNIMGLWIANQTLNCIGGNLVEIQNNLDGINYYQTFDVNDSSLLAPKNMKEAVMVLLKDNPPKNEYELFASIYQSLALSYKNTIDELEEITNRKYNKIVIVGGGAHIKYLNNMTEKLTGKKVIPMPIEATALGNIKMQMKGNKDL